MVSIGKGIARHTLVAGVLACLLLDAPAPARADLDGLPDDRLGVGTAPLLLLSRKDVRDDVGLSEAQSREAEAAIVSFYERARALRGQSGPAIIAARKSIDTDQFRWIEAHLSPQQRTRLVQVDLQWEGPAALVTRPMVADALDLTPEQRSVLKNAVALCDDARRKSTYSPADEAALTKTTLATLTPPQRDRWRAILGRAFEPKRVATRPAVRTAAPSSETQPPRR